MQGIHLYDAKKAQENFNQMVSLSCTKYTYELVILLQAI